ncbi:unnamed protein product [Acanthoscelides obtectus]|uniref:Transposase n=1 Tax=Acanthoscelides obtectus TaxID=200917 RepID=A0A9P0JWS6_ACAOB|nr:unnamed protein product [Acanthoscelides obtectus]CAK1668139.1 Histone-lysine N-methyltransferase SETMAR [Acanthoscelides obtectus]
MFQNGISVVTDWFFSSSHLGSKTDLYNYRLIALLSVISKVTEMQINRELLDYLERHGLITDRRYGFRHQRSTGDLVLSVFVNEAPHQSTISRWYGEFKRGRVSLSDDSRVDRHVTYREIEASLKISRTSIQNILHEELGIRKLVSQQKAAIVNWCQKTLDRFNSGNSKKCVQHCEEKPTKVIRSRSVSKKMVATFVSKAGHIATIPLDEQITLTVDWYTIIYLPKVITELRKINPERRIILHQDNASSHTAQKTRQYLTEENVELLDQPPYSPDPSPNDFFTFPKIKKRLRGQRFQSPEEAVDAFKNAVLDLPANEWNKCFENWFERMQMCINLRNRVDENPSTSTRDVAREVQVSKTKVWQTLREEGLYPFHVQRVQALQPDDFPARVRFCEWLLHQHDNNPDFLKCILVTDKSTFTLENPHAVRRAHFQQTFSVNVWAGMVNGMLIGPFILPNRLDGMQYLDFLRNILPSLLEDVPLSVRQSMWFLHDVFE